VKRNVKRWRAIRRWYPESPHCCTESATRDRRGGRERRAIVDRPAAKFHRRWKIAEEHDECSLNPYLYFNGQCEEAFRFYEKCLGGKITFMMMWKDSARSSATGLGQEDPACRARLKRRCIGRL
jgi:hypothetical protein